MAECPFSKYAKDGNCQTCDDSCNGCTGPRNTIADDGCIDCDHIIFNGTLQKCLKKNSTCPGKTTQKLSLLTFINL